MPEGRHVEIWGSIAVAYGRLYFMAEDGLYCIGDKGAPFTATASPRAKALAAPAAAPDAPAARLLVVPAEVVAKAGEPLRVRGLGVRRQGPLPAQGEGAWSLEGLAGTITPDGRLTDARGRQPRSAR